MVTAFLGGSLVMVVWEVAVVGLSGRGLMVRRLWKSWNGGGVVWRGCHVCEVSQSVLRAEPEAGGSHEAVVL